MQYLYSGLLLVITLLWQNKATADSASLRFCYEDKPLLPFYNGHGDLPAPKPGAAIEHLQAVAKATNIELVLIRQPWLRCLAQLEANQVDALVAEYASERDYYMQAPRRPDGQLDESLAMSSFSLCLTYHQQGLLPEKLSQQREFALARPLGYRPLPMPGPHIEVSADSISHALELVSSGRVDATTVLCELNGITVEPAELLLRPLQIYPTPVYHSVGYLMFSKAFYQQNPDLAVRIWQQVAQQRDTNRYLDYLQQPQQ